MGILKKAALLTIGATAALTAGVAVQNATQVKSDEEVGHKQGFYEKYVKRPQDFFCATAATIVLSPVLAGTAVLVKLKLGSPVLFTQDRPGLNGKVFKLYKFRTMLPPKDGIIDPKQDADRLTPFGRKLRSTSLDELPELFNMIKGDMAVVGPRPLLVQYLDRYNEHQARRHEVRPGFSGLAQVHGRNAISWEEKFAYDLEYVKNISFPLDVKILFETVIKVFKHEGIGQGEQRPVSLHVERKGKELR